MLSSLSFDRIIRLRFQSMCKEYHRHKLVKNAFHHWQIRLMNRRADRRYSSVLQRFVTDLIVYWFDCLLVRAVGTLLVSLILGTRRKTSGTNSVASRLNLIASRVGFRSDISWQKSHNCCGKAWTMLLTDIFHRLRATTNCKKMLRHCPLFWLDWPVYDFVLVILSSYPYQSCYQYKTMLKTWLNNFKWMEGGGECYISQTCD